MFSKNVWPFFALALGIIFAAVGYIFLINRTNPTNSVASFLPFLNRGAISSDVASNSSDLPQPTSQPVAVTYQGTLPCADCEGLQTTLTLDPSPDGQPLDRIGSTYQMTEAYLGKSVASIQTSGSWILQNPLAYPTSKLDSNQILLVLDHLNPDKRTIFWLKTQTSLVQLDADGNEIDSPLNFTLTLEGADPNPSIEPYVLPPLDSSPPPGVVPMDISTATPTPSGL